MNDTFNAVLAEMRERASRMLYVGPHKIIAALDRLAAAHAAEVAERDARIAYRDNIIAGHAADTRKYQKQLQQSEARAETAEARVRELEAYVADRESEIEAIKAERASAEDQAEAASGQGAEGWTIQVDSDGIWATDPDGSSIWLAAAPTQEKGNG